MCELDVVDMPIDDPLGDNRKAPFDHRPMLCLFQGDDELRRIIVAGAEEKDPVCCSHYLEAGRNGRSDSARHIISASATASIRVLSLCRRFEKKPPEGGFEFRRFPGL
jgi:hypothetical protein